MTTHIQDKEQQREARELIQKIRRAFASVSREDGVSLHEIESLDYENKRNPELAKLDTDKSWEEVPAEWIEASGGTAFLDDKGFRYYLPSYMIHYLNREDSQHNSNSITYETLFYGLLIPRDADPVNEPATSSLHKYRLLSREQCEAVWLFLNYAVKWDNNSDAEEALKGYWSKFSLAK